MYDKFDNTCEGRMKLFGTNVYPKNKYLTLQMTRSAKGVFCEDVFDSLDVTAAAGCDFKGGAGAAIDEATVSKAGKEIAEPCSLKFASDDDACEDSDRKDENDTQTMSGTPVRQSARNAGKTLKMYTDLSSGGHSSDNDDETAEVPEDLDDTEMESLEIEYESENKDVKPTDSSTVALSSKKNQRSLTLLSGMPESNYFLYCYRDFDVNSLPLNSCPCYVRNA